MSSREKEIDDIQSKQYSFPYHYIPSSDDFPSFAKVWSFAASYLAANRLFAEWFNALKKEEQHMHLDLGCGDGALINTVCNKPGYQNYTFHGIDFDNQAIILANFMYINTTPDGPCIKFQAQDLSDVEANSYDSVSLIEVYEHIPPSECEQFLRKISDIMKPGAEIFITVPSIEKPLYSKHYRHFNHEIMIKEFSDKFEIKELIGFEKTNIFIRILRKILHNNKIYIEFKIVNLFIINYLSKKHKKQKNCGRILLIGRSRKK